MRLGRGGKLDPQICSTWPTTPSAECGGGLVREIVLLQRRGDPSIEAGRGGETPVFRNEAAAAYCAIM
jgi:hypothetical protein